MAFEIKNAVSASTVNNNVNISTEKPVVSESQSSSASVQNNYSVTPVEIKQPENNQSGNAESGNSKEPTEKQVRTKIEYANNELKYAKTGLNFKYHEATKRVSITVYDKDTKEVIREIPPEKSLDMLEKMWELAGMVIDDRG